MRILNGAVVVWCLSVGLIARGEWVALALCCPYRGRTEWDGWREGVGGRGMEDEPALCIGGIC